MISYKKISEAWNNFFFVPQPTESMAMFRILWCSMLFIYFLFDINNIENIYGPHAVLSMQTVQNQFPQTHLNLFNIFGNSYSFLYFFFGIYGLALIASILGFYTRISLITVLCCMVTLHHRNIWVTSSSETLMRIMTILLVCSPCGHTLSIDSILGQKYKKFYREKDWAPWALRLMQIQLSVVYICTVWQKLKGETWFDGTAVYYATRFESMKNLPVPYLLDSLALLKLMTWGTLVMELSLGILVWIKEFRIPVIIMGILFHLGIEYTMCIPFFEWAMIILITLYVTPLEVRAWISNLNLSKLDVRFKQALRL